MYSEKFDVPVPKLMKRLWDNNYFNLKTKKWSKTKDSNDKNVVRGFNQFVLDPIYKVGSLDWRHRDEVYAQAVHFPQGLRRYHE